MHHDDPIKDQTTKIKGDHGPHDMGSCPLFARDVDASKSFDQDQTGDVRGIVGSCPHNNCAIVAVDPSSPNWTVRDYRAIFL